MSAEEPHLYLEPTKNPRPPKHSLSISTFVPSVVQRFLSVAGILHHSRYEEFLLTHATCAVHAHGCVSHDGNLYALVLKSVERDGDDLFLDRLRAALGAV